MASKPTQRSLKRGPSPKRIDMLGRRFGRLVVLRFARTGGKNWDLYWLCRCDCGQEKEINGQHLRSGHVISCRCANYELCAAACRRNAAKKFQPEATGTKTMYAIYRQSARTRRLEFSIPFDEFSVIIKQNCRYCGATPSNEYFNRSEVRPYRFKYSGLDRTDNAKGYISTNVVPCCDTCNSAKQDLTVTEFREWVTRLYWRFERIARGE